MQNSNGRIVKNVRALLIGQLCTWTLSLLWVIYLPRYIGDTGMGRYAIALAIWAIMSTIVNTGTATHLTGEIARSPEKAPELLGTALIQRCIIFIACCVPVAAYAYFMQYNYETIILIWIVATSIPASQASATLGAVFQGLEHMQYIPLIDIVVKTIVLAGSLALMFFNFGINEIAFVTTIAITIGTAIQFAILGRFIPISLAWNNALSRDMIVKSVPFFLSSLVLALYSQIDKLIISAMLDEQVVGWYSIAGTFAGTLVFLPNILQTAIFPALSRGVAQPGDDVARILRKSLDVCLLTGVPIAFGLAIVATPLVNLVYHSEFPESGPVLAVMSITLIFIYIATVLGRYLVASGRTNIWTLAMLVCIGLAFPLNYIFVTWSQNVFGNGAIGGALRFACTECLLALFALWMLPRGTLTWDNASIALRIFCSGFVMVAACWLVRDMFIAVPIAVGVVTYTAMILLLRVLKPEDVDMLVNTGRSALAMIRPRPDVSRGDKP